eukprot:7217364-Heterocapsa_arctica.AAC.1
MARISSTPRFASNGRLARECAGACLFIAPALRVGRTSAAFACRLPTRRQGALRHSSQRGQKRGVMSEERLPSRR